MFGFCNHLFFVLSGVSFTIGLGGFISAILWLIRQRSQASFSVNTMRLGFIAMLVVGVIASLLLADYLWLDINGEHGDDH